VSGHCWSITSEQTLISEDAAAALYQTEMVGELAML
jgi:hypothetical protein